jgi:beta-ribofuranosylaminobenzene 5'-phosphate synthase
MSSDVEVHAPCRLHFGMFSFGHQDRAQFGGVGVMVEPPGVKVRISPAARFDASGASPERTRQIVERCVTDWKTNAAPSCNIDVHSPETHTGLGVGTQVGLAIAAGLRRFLQLPGLATDELARSAGRGLRSAVGTHGFRHGGLIVDGGKKPGETLGKLAARLPLPDAWRFVLLCPKVRQGLSGPSEATAFDRLPPVPDWITRKLWAITNEQMLPAAEREDCAAFGEAVYHYGILAGECFSVVQGGPFANAEIESFVDLIRGNGVAGVGQSSWGPTVFAIVESEESAGQLVDWLRGRIDGMHYEILVALVNNSGARIEENRQRT